MDRGRAAPTERGTEPDRRHSPAESGKLIAIMKLMVGHHVLLVDHEHGDRSHTFQPGIFTNELRETSPAVRLGTFRRSAERPTISRMTAK